MGDLEKHQLVTPADDASRRTLTADGDALWRFLSADDHVTGALRFLEGRRLLAVPAPSGTNAESIEGVLKHEALALLHADQDCEYVGVYPDDQDLVRALRTSVERLGAQPTVRVHVRRVEQPRSTEADDGT